MANHAMSGVISIIPIDGITRRSGLMNQSVRRYDHRIHFEYGEIEIHVERTRTINASFTIPNAHDAASSLSCEGSCDTTTSWYKMPLRNSSSDINAIAKTTKAMN